ncbi:MAG: EAL domain-containing protein [Halomonadaceae bacterium]|nr:MAG: EAL domain-containing protein [Halomonadaceae bacterium]
MPQKPGKHSLQLHEFLQDEQEAILREWETIDRKEFAITQDMSEKDLRNNLPNLLNDIAEQAHKQSPGKGPIREISSESPVEHAEHRWHSGFTLKEVTREYSILRAVILQQLAPRIAELGSQELVFLNQTLDLAIIEAVETYVESSNKSLQEERERLQVTLKCIGDGVVTTDIDGRVVYLNPVAEKASGWSQEEAVGRPVNDVLVPIDEETGKPTRNLIEIVTETEEISRHSVDILLRKRNGDFLPVENVAAPLRDSQGHFMGVVTTFRDVSRIRALTEKLGYLAGHDPLTHLPNRMLLHERLSLELAHAARHDSRVALLYLDLDLFKDVNDSFGHSTGDLLLQQVAQRLSKCVRRADTVSRLGGDEFAIVLTEFGNLDHLCELCEKIAEQIRAPYTIKSETIEISTSVGISIYPEDGNEPETLIQHADMAMYQAKERGRNHIQFFAPEMHKRATERRKLAGDLRKSIALKQLFLNFQPQVELCTGHLIGVETLLRWRHPRHGLIPPDRFIPVAEDNRQTMLAIGNWVLENSCQQARAWLDSGHLPLRISVNVSVIQLRGREFLEHVATVLRRFELPASCLQLEITESILMSDTHGAMERIRELRKLGVRVSIDDFGTGYSSLSHLKDLPVDELKIDQSFVRNIESDRDKSSIVQAIIRMGQSMELRVLAEGVENLEAAEFLSARGCEGAQGYYYSQPIRAAAFEQKYLAHKGARGG